MDAKAVAGERPEVRLPVPVALLLLAALVAALWHASLLLSQNSFPRDIPPAVVASVQSATSFVLAAALVGGAGRWQASRFWLIGAGLLFTAHGVLVLISRIYWNGFDIGGRSLDEVQAQATTLWISIAAAAAAAAVLAAIGVWSARPRPLQIGHTAVVGMAALAVIGLLALGGYVSEVAFSFAIPDPVQAGRVIEYWVLHLGWPAGVLLLAFAALLEMEPDGSAAELLIAGGAALALVGDGWRAWVPLLGQAARLSPPWDLLYIVPAALATIGLLVMAAGLAVGRVRAT